ncbi:hypothetical protein Pcinc_019605 [Petrolisthes cinctipes]|uniref:legumain n=1 Tax=Petrolisthes cinctipes TaxID=88211 RepID=A0AAE1KHI2_PETCI|nr:hypothetical protein Pcinc_019605 [Petrolisthes cinctipes]
MDVRLVCVVAAVVALCGGCGETAVVGARDQEDEGQLWAVLVAGSTGWFNYRHQADVCHAYQILRQHGVPDDHIIVMMMDDIVNSLMNPKPGKLMNRPDGPDVYQGVPKDYTGDDVTPENFLKVLAGDTEGLMGVGSGKVLGSGPNDRVFINLVDHGGPGIFGFPKTFLHARAFVSALTKMHRNKQYKEMTIYLESCNSGSMFKTLPNDIEVYGVSASNATQTSSACYWEEKMQTFLGDVFSVKWMEDTDRENVGQETLETQFFLVRNETNTSIVTQWGQKSLDDLKVGDFLGDGNVVGGNTEPMERFDDACLKSAVSSVDVPVKILEHLVQATVAQPEQYYWLQQLHHLHLNRSLVTQRMLDITRAVTKDEMVAQNMIKDQHHHINHHHCFERSTDTFNRICFNFGMNPYALTVVNAIVNLCEHGYTADEFITAATTVCRDGTITGIN